MKNLIKIDLGAVWVPKAVSGTRLDTLGATFGRPNPGELSERLWCKGAVERAFGSIFRRFCLAVRKLRCALCTNFQDTLLARSTIGSERACVAKTLEKPSVSASKTIPGNVRAIHINQARAAQFE